MFDHFSGDVSRAEQLAAEIKELQGEMADYNTVRIEGGYWSHSCPCQLDVVLSLISLIPS